jgi:hypothetical protein
MTKGLPEARSLRWLIAAAVAAFALPAMAQDLPSIASETGACSCVQNSCNNACIRKPNPEVIAALRKRFRGVENDELMVLADGQGGWDVAPKGHFACNVKLKPKVKLSFCRQVHA